MNASKYSLEHITPTSRPRVTSYDDAWRIWNEHVLKIETQFFKLPLEYQTKIVEKFNTINKK